MSHYGGEGPLKSCGHRPRRSMSDKMEDWSDGALLSLLFFIMFAVAGVIGLIVAL